MSVYLDGLRAKRAALTARQLAAGSAVLLLCPHCHGELHNGNRGGPFCEQCHRPVWPVSIVVLINDLARAIAWATAGEAWREMA